MSAIEASEPREVTTRRVILIALPVALSNATAPIQGAIDTAIIGSLGEVSSLGAIGLGAEIFAVLFASFNFLQMGVSGLSAQAFGAGRRERVAHTLLRGLIIAIALSALMILARDWIRDLGMRLFEASVETETLAGRYVDIRIFGAPAELMSYALLGWFIGQEMTQRLFVIQLIVSGANVALTAALVLGFGWGVEGAALGTLIASYLGLGAALWMAWARLPALVPRGWRPKRDRLLDLAELRGMMALNRDIFIRTLLLAGGMAWIARLGSLQGDEILAANVVLWHFFTISSTSLDGFAMAAETLVGQSLGARNLRRLDRAVWMSSIWAGLQAALLATLFWISSGTIIDWFTAAPEIRALAREYALWACLIPLVGFMAFQMDGVFIGATASAEMRNAMIFCALIYYPLSEPLMERFGNDGVWAALWMWLILRAVTLLALYPRIRSRAGA